MIALVALATLGFAVPVALLLWNIGTGVHVCDAGIVSVGVNDVDVVRWEDIDRFAVGELREDRTVGFRGLGRWPPHSAHPDSGAIVAAGAAGAPLPGTQQPSSLREGSHIARRHADSVHERTRWVAATRQANRPARVRSRRRRC